MDEAEKARKIKFEQDKAQWQKWQEEIAFKKNQVDRGLTNYQALIEWHNDPRNRTDLGLWMHEKGDVLKDMILGLFTGGLGKLSNEVPSNAHSLIDSLIAENDTNNIRNEFNKVSGNPGIGHYRK